MVKYNIETVREYYKKQGCELISDTYENDKTIMGFKCYCGKEGSKTFQAFKRTPHCKNCKGEPPNGENESSYMSYKEIDEFFQEKECILLTKVIINDQTSLEFICFCGMTAEKNFASFKRAPHCTSCKTKVLN